MAKNNTEFQDKFKNFKNRIQSESPEVPLQMVVPTKNIKAKEDKEPEVQLGLRIPKSMIKLLKQHSLENDLAIKEIIVLAINQYFSKL
jgi:hypothetical protein